MKRILLKPQLRLVGKFRSIFLFKINNYSTCKSKVLMSEKKNKGFPSYNTS